MTLKREVGPLSMRILGILDDGSRQTVATIQETLARDGHEVAYTTVMTVLRRLHDRGAVKRVLDGKRYIYQSMKSSRHSTKGILQRVHRALFKHARLAPIAALVEGELTRSELEQLRSLIDARLEAQDDV